MTEWQQSEIAFTYSGDAMLDLIESGQWTFAQARQWLKAVRDSNQQKEKSMSEQVTPEDVKRADFLLYKFMSSKSTDEMKENAKEIAQLLAAERRVIELEKILPDAGKLTCVYCGFKIDLKSGQSDTMADHILSCEKNPVLNMCRDAMDMYKDEFHRIRSLTDNTEIQGLCDRAMSDIKQHVPVIEQRDNAIAAYTDIRAWGQGMEAQLQTIIARCDEYVSRSTFPQTSDRAILVRG